MVFCIVVLFSTTSIDQKYLFGENNVEVRFILETGVPRTLMLTVSDSRISSAILSASPASTSTECKIHRESQGALCFSVTGSTLVEIIATFSSTPIFSSDSSIITPLKFPRDSIFSILMLWPVIKAIRSSDVYSMNTKWLCREQIS